DQHRPDRHAADEVLGSVDGVDDEAAILRALLAELLAEEAVAGTGAAEHRLDGLLRLAVGLGDRRLVRLDRHLEAAAVVFHRDLTGGPARCAHRGHSRVHRAGRGHSFPSPRSTRTALKTSRASTTTGMPP